MGGFLGLGNSSAKTDRGNQLAGINAGWNVYNRGLPLADTMQGKGEATTDTGVSGLQAAQSYWKNIMAGGPAAQQAASPVVNAARGQADAAKAQEAEMGTSRGGGTGAGNQEREFKTEGNINTAIAGVQPLAAEQGAQVSGTIAQTGQAELAKALQSLGLSAEVSNEIIDSSIKSRPVSMEANAQVRQQWSNFLASLGF